MKKNISVEEAVSMVKDGMTVLVGGFLACGTPNRIIDALAKSNVKDLTLVCNDSAFEDRGVGQLIVNRQVKKLIASHIGTNPTTGNQMNAKELEVELVPQGTLAERLRCGGCGLGGVLTDTGLGTIVAEGKTVITVDGKEYLLEKPLRGDIALLGASVADQYGNLLYRGTTQNFNPLMAMAADVVIAEATESVDMLPPETVKTPHILVDYIVR